jgi:hypothetical protein
MFSAKMLIKCFWLSLIQNKNCRIKIKMKIEDCLDTLNLM